jgi:hypothetical protein
MAGCFDSVTESAGHADMFIRSEEASPKEDNISRHAYIISRSALSSRTSLPTEWPQQNHA